VSDQAKSSHPELEGIAAGARQFLDAVDAAREDALAVSRQIIRSAAMAIKHVHRQEFAEARAVLDETSQSVRQINERLVNTPSLWFAGFVQDGLKEYAEAEQTYHILLGRPLPGFEALDVPPMTYLNGLGEVIGELRRHVLDLIRLGDADRAQATLDLMDDLFSMLMTFDYPDAVSFGLRRRVDAARGMVERTRGDVTNALQQARLEAKMAQLRAHVDERPS
jgi:translin